MDEINAENYEQRDVDLQEPTDRTNEPLSRQAGARWIEATFLDIEKSIASNTLSEADVIIAELNGLLQHGADPGACLGELGTAAKSDLFYHFLRYRVRAIRHECIQLHQQKAKVVAESLRNLADAENRLADAENRLADTKKHEESLQDELKKLESDHCEMRKHLVDVKDALARAQKNNAALQATVSEIHASRSWRLLHYVKLMKSRIGHYVFGAR